MEPEFPWERKERLYREAKERLEEAEAVAGEEAKFCAPNDFGGWHLTFDGETTLCGIDPVESHHISGTFDVFRPETDCTNCYRIYRTIKGK